MSKSAVREETTRPAAKEADLYSWARRQAELLRAGRLSEIDAAAIAEEIDDVGEEQYDKLESALRVLILHLLKWDHQPSMRSRSWTLTIREQRDAPSGSCERIRASNPRSTRRLEAAYEDARLEAANETGLPLSIFPTRRPFDHSEIMQRSIVWPGDED